MKSPRPKTTRCSTTELLLLPDGQILVHNLTPAMAAVLAKLNPNDELMRERMVAEIGIKSKITIMKTAASVSVLPVSVND